MRDRGRHAGQYHTELAGVTGKGGCGSWHSHRNCGVRFRTQCLVQPLTRRAVQGGTQLAIERASQAGLRCRTRRATDCRIERGVEARTDHGPEFPGLGAIGRRAEPRTRRATDPRAKSLIDSHIDGSSERGLEPRSHPRIDPLVAGRSAEQDRCPWFAPAFRFSRRGGLSPAPRLLTTNRYLLTANSSSPRHNRLLHRPEARRIETEEVDSGRERP